MKYCARIFLLITAPLVLGACGGGGRTNQWDDIDYSKVARQNRAEYDTGYTPPTVTGCTDDDLYNCSAKTSY